MAVTNVSTNTLTVVRQTNRTNSAGANITTGNNAYVVPGIEVAQILEVPNSTTIEVTRGWYNMPSLNSAAVGSIIQKLSGNVELVQHSSISTAVNGTQTIGRGAFGTTAIAAAGAGSLFVRMTGLYNASTNANIPLVAVNAPDHGITGGEGEYCTVLTAADTDVNGINVVSALGYNTNNFSYYPRRSIS